jgi:hypothetical protein
MWSISAFGNDMNQLNLQEAVSASNTTSRRSLEATEADSLSPEITDACSLAPASLLPAWCFVGLGAVCVCAMAWAGIVGSRDCRVQPIPLALGVDVDVSIAVPASTPCTILLSAGSLSLEDIAIATPPGHGTATMRGRTGATYRPAPRFKGDDSFAFAIRGRSGSATDMSVIRVRTTIR